VAKLFLWIRVAVLNKGVILDKSQGQT